VEDEKLTALGRLKTISLVIIKLSVKPLMAAQALTWLNSISVPISVCLGTNNIVSSAYLNIVQLRPVCKSLFMTIYIVGPIPDPWTIPRPILATFDNRPLIVLAVFT